MNLTAWYGQLARYNQTANARLYECCAQASEAERRKARRVSFGSIHALLNHILLGDRIWMARFEGGGSTTPPLHTVLYDDFEELCSARVAEDGRIVSFFGTVPDDFPSRTVSYTNSKGVRCTDHLALAVAHFFNHQTHHRGQIHAMLSDAGIAPPSLDMHRILNP
jgi:uncharacterized damage-inducible protein DinB